MRVMVCLAIGCWCCTAQAQGPAEGIVASPHNPPLRVGDKVVGTWTTMECIIERYQGDWAWIHTEDGKEGWVRSDEVAPLGKAVELFTKKIEAEPRNTGWRQARAIAWRRQGELDRAIADISEAIALAPPDLDHYYNTRGNFYLEKKDYERALADYNEAIRRRADNAYAWNNAGLARRAKGEYAKAVENFTRAIALDPAYPNAYENRARTWTDQHDYDRALADYERAIGIDSKSIYAYLGRAALWESKGEYARALADYEKPAQFDPENPEAHNALAWLLATCREDQVRDGQRAVAEALKACELANWKKPNAVDTLAAAYAETGDFENAVKYAERALDIAPEDQQPGCRERLELYRQKKPYRQPVN